METDYLTKIEALEFIKECERRDVFIYGLERYEIVDGKIMPDMDGIADFSAISINDVSKSILSAKNFMDLFDDSSGQRFTITYYGQDL